MAAADCSAGGVAPPALLVSLAVRPPTLLVAAEPTWTASAVELPWWVVLRSGVEVVVRPSGLFSLPWSTERHTFGRSRVHLNHTHGSSSIHNCKPSQHQQRR